MGTSYRFFEKDGVVAYQASGRIQFRDLKDLFFEIQENPLFHPGLKGIADLRAMQPEGGLSQLKELAQYTTEDLKENCSWATLVNDPLLTALSLVFSKMVSGRRTVEICSTLERASELVGEDVRPYLDALEGVTYNASSPEV